MLRHPHFCEKRGAGGVFCGHILVRGEKKFYFLVAHTQCVVIYVAKKMKKNFGGIKNVRIFAPAFERRGRPAEGAERGGSERYLKQVGPER